MRRSQTTTPNNNGKRKDLVRLSHNVKPKEKETWIKSYFKAAEIDGIRDPNSGTYMSRIINLRMPLDQASLSKVSDFLDAHHLRDKDPART